MPPLKDSFDGAYVADKLRSGAAQLIADRDAIRAREASGQPDPEQTVRDTITVVQRPEPPWPHDPLREPRTRWETLGPNPLGVPHQVVTASQSEALRNKQSLRELMERRMRRLYRQALIASKLMSEADAKARSMRLIVHVEFANHIILPRG